jgi:cephalosporin hydroxylase
VLRRRERAERLLGRTHLAVNGGAAPHHRANGEDKRTVRRVAAATLESVRSLAKSALAIYSYQPTGSESEEYHKWYYNTFVWKKTTWMGITCWKSVSDMWNYQEILFDLKPSLVIEFGTNQGGSASFFANVMRLTGKPFKVLSVDVTHKPLDPAARRDPDILFVESSSTVPAVAEHIRRLKGEFPGRTFAILDSDHRMDHVLAEMKLLRPLLSAGDYLLVEDSTVNGHPVLPGWGPGPYEAIAAYEHEFPSDYTHDVARENKFGFTFAPNGFLIRN